MSMVALGIRQKALRSYSTGGNALRQAPTGRIKLEFSAVHSNHLRVTKKDQALVGKCKAALTLSVQKVRDSLLVVEYSSVWRRQGR